MRVIRGLFCGGLFLALVLLLGSGLVEGPGQAPPPEARRSVNKTALLPVPAAAGEMTPERDTQRQAGTREVFFAGRAPVACCTICRDGQGLPLGDAPWYRAAWAACPPEGRFG